jgi:hypothetical protein
MCQDSLLQRGRLEGKPIHAFVGLNQVIKQEANEALNIEVAYSDKLPAAPEARNYTQTGGTL